MTADELRAIHEQLKAATSRPWFVPGTDDGEYVVCHFDKKGKRRTLAHVYAPGDAAFIGHAPANIAALLELLREIDALADYAPDTALQGAVRLKRIRSKLEGLGP